MMNEKKERFAQEYLVDLNATQAAIRAGYSEKTARSQGQRLLTDVDIQAAITAGQKARSERTLITQDRVLEELASIAFANKVDLVDWGMKEIRIGYDDQGKRLGPAEIGEATVVLSEWGPYVEPVNAADLTESQRRAVKKVGLNAAGFVIETHDKVGALAKLGDHLGLFKRKLELSGPDGEPLLDDLSVATRLAALMALAQTRKAEDGG